MKIAIVGGTGIYGFGNRFKKVKINTPYGEVQADRQILDDNQKELIFLPRHGKNHQLPPHKINYRANLWALKELGTKYIFATNAVGSLNPSIKPGELALFTDFIDATKNRVSTFYDGDSGVVHTNMADPYCFELRKLIKRYSEEFRLVFKEGIYICTEGPRFETAAEINTYRNWGADFVGMTGVPEVVLAKELGLCYTGIGIVTNWATGMAHDHLIEEIIGAVDENRNQLTRFLIDLIKKTDFTQANCQCRKANLTL